MAASGTLYLVATPIGNLEDITYRAVRVLKEAGLIACEDTRQTGKLLARYGISSPVISYHEFNEKSRAEELLSRLREGTSVALVSDAGTPLVSDPGYRLVTRVVEEGIPVEPIPGPSAVLTALVASGLPTDAFHFGGFLPAKAGQRRKALEEVKDLRATLVFYEAPHRILDALTDVEEILGHRSVVIARELTKMHQEFLRGTAGDLRRVLESRPAVKGEITLLIAKSEENDTVSDVPIPEAVERLIVEGMARMDAIKAVAHQRGLSKRDVYREVEASSRKE